jgi:hypothetical protein
MPETPAKPRFHLARRCAAFVATVLVGLLVAWSASSARLPEGAEVLEAKGEMRWLKGNLHTHTHWSDGDDYPEMVALWYRKRGYAFLVMTDHNTLQEGRKWVDLEKTKGGTVAYEKLKTEFPGIGSKHAIARAAPKSG